MSDVSKVINDVAENVCLRTCKQAGENVWPGLTYTYCDESFSYLKMKRKILLSENVFKNKFTFIYCKSKPDESVVTL